MTNEELVAQLQADPHNERLFDELFLRVRRLIYHEALHFQHSTKDMPDDLFSASLPALLKAVESFDVTAGTRFSTYLCRVVENAMLKYIEKEHAKRRTAKIVPIDEPISKSKNGGQPLRAEELVGYEDDLSSPYCTDIERIAFEYIRRQPSANARRALYYLVSTDMAQIDIARKLNISKQSVYAYVKKFREYMQESLQQVDIIYV